ncbi:hypothetical protein K501DRAFT_277524 [Backusella circina FSU 941]|nr:hypothetical protein K501DRAFT_277524 [Backusella circina FSU 941]
MNLRLKQEFFDRTFKKSILAASILIFALSQVSAHRPGGGGGGGAVQRTGVIEQCEYPGVDGLFITNEKYAYANASLACESYGGSLADITNQNYLLGADMVLTCIGPNNKAWIGSWDYRDINADPKEGVYDCLGLSVGNIGPGGGVDKSCTGVIPALCQSQPSVVQHNPRYSEPVWAHSQGAAVPTVASTQRETDKNTYPVMYPNFDGGIYRPAIPHGYDDRDTEQGNPVFYPGAGSVWGGSTPQQPREHYKGQYVKPVRAVIYRFTYLIVFTRLEDSPNSYSAFEEDKFPNRELANQQIVSCNH